VRHSGIYCRGVRSDGLGVMASMLGIVTEDSISTE
jgi:hypothetical protein